MSLASPPVPSTETLADLLDRLGGVSPARIRMHPPPGTATVDDLIALTHGEDRLFELIDGVIVEKTYGFMESVVTSAVCAALYNFVDARDLGAITGPGGPYRFNDRMVLLPDVTYASWEHFPDDRSLEESVPHVVPDLAVNVVKRENTPGEMNRKLRDYIEGGVPVVWFVEPRDRTVTVYTSLTDAKIIPESGTLDGGKVLPGFALPVAKLFARLKRKAKKGGK